MKNNKEIKSKSGKKIANKQLKKILPIAFITPPPLHKDIFLQEIKQRKEISISNKEFIFIQIKYIRKITWFLSFMLFLFTVIGTQLMNRNMLWYFAAFIPFLAICGVTEYMRSENFGMAELEQASRFSLKSVMFARLGILGVVHFILIFLVLFMVNRSGTYHLLQSTVYLMVPYFMTTFSGLWISRKIHGKESVYACMGAAVMVSMLQGVLGYMQELIYTADLFQLWFVGLILFIIFTIKEIKIGLTREEIVWSLL